MLSSGKRESGRGNRMFKHSEIGCDWPHQWGLTEANEKTRDGAERGEAGPGSQAPVGISLT